VICFSELPRRSRCVRNSGACGRYFNFHYRQVLLAEQWHERHQSGCPRAMTGRTVRTHICLWAGSTDADPGFAAAHSRVPQRAARRGENENGKQAKRQISPAAHRGVLLPAVCLEASQTANDDWTRIALVCSSRMAALFLFADLLVGLLAERQLENTIMDIGKDISPTKKKEHSQYVRRAEPAILTAESVVMEVLCKIPGCISQILSQQRSGSIVCFGVGIALGASIQRHRPE
jgi:hypothetical protein